MTGNQIEKIETPSQLGQRIKQVMPYLDRLLDNPRRFATTLIAEARRNPAILDCEASSVIGAVLTCAQLDLDPGPAEHVWLIPRWNGKLRTNELTVLIGYKGFKALAERHPNIVLVQKGTVCRNDHFVHTAQPPHLEHTPYWDGDRGEPYLWYAIAHTTEGPNIIAVLDRKQVEARRAKSQTPNKGPWVDHYDAMAEKSALRALWPNLPSSLDMQRAAHVDDQGVVTVEDLGIVTEEQDAIPPGTGEVTDVEQVQVDLVDGDGNPVLTGTVTDDAPPPSEDAEASLVDAARARGMDVHDLDELARDRFDTPVKDLTADQQAALTDELTAAGASA